jgi:DNA-binding PadR family transcriptional regulator
LQEEGLATVEVVPSTDRPSRKVYSITDSGREVLRGWIDQPAAADAPLKAFVMRLLLADLFPPSGLRAHLGRRRAQVAAHRAALQKIGRALEGGTDLGEQLALDYGLAMATAELAWLEAMLARPSKGKLAEEDHLSHSPALAG